MRLAVFTNQFPGPVSTFFARDMRGLIEAGIEVDIFPIYPLDPTLWRYVPDILNEKVLPRSRVHHLTFSECLKTARLWPSRKSLRFLKDFFSINVSAISHGVDPVAKSSYVSVKAWTWAQKFENQYDQVLAYWGNYAATSAYIFHRLIGETIPFSMFLHAGIDLYRKPVFMRQKLLSAHRIILVCEFNKQFLERHYSDIFPMIANKIYIHDLGLDLKEMHFSPNSRPPRKVIAVGRIEKGKGIDYLLKAVHELKHRGIEVQVELIGDGSVTSSLRELARNLGIIDQVAFRGWLTFDEVQIAMQNATILSHASPDIGDAVPTVIKEAMAVGTPVIGTKVAGIPELLDNGKCGILIPPKSVSALANAIADLLASRELQYEYARRAREHAERKFDMWLSGRRLGESLRATDSNPSFV